MGAKQREPFNEGEFSGFFHDLAERLQSVDKLNLSTAPHFNVFRYIMVDAGELMLSRIIRDLLDPAGAHGQGDCFLKCFLKIIIGRPDLEIGASVAADTEALTTGASNPFRKIDILLGLDGRFGIGIENKPWAGDQPGFVEDYSQHLRSRFGESFCLVFLTKDRNEPEQESDRKEANGLAKQGKFLAIQYGTQFSDWLTCCQENCAAENVKQFLKDFRDYARTLEVESMVSEHEVSAVVDYILREPDKFPPDKFAIANAVHEAWGEVHAKLAREFLSELQRILQAELGQDWYVVNPGGRIFESWHKFSICREQWRAQPGVVERDPKNLPTHRHAIVLESDKQGGDFRIGVWKNGHEVPSVAGLREKLNADLGRTFGPHRHVGGTYYDWGVPVPEKYRSWDKPATLKDLAKKNQALDDLKGYFLAIKEAAAPLIDLHYPVAA